jgi:hypothetical protein
MMKFKDARPYADVAAAEKKLLELANAMEADKGRVPVGALNTQFIIGAGGSVAEYSAGMKAAIAHGYFTMHASGGYVSFTQADADLFA